MPRCLIVYSSPEPLDRLRLDKEHKAIERVLEKRGLGETEVRRIHAANIIDVGAALNEEQYDVVYFSTHGDEQGLTLESDCGPSTVTWAALAKTLSDGAPALVVLVINACKSTFGQQPLQKVAPFLILMDGDVADEAAILFSETFLDEFFTTGEVELAFRRATWTLEMRDIINPGFLCGFAPVLLRRQPAGQSVIQARFGVRQDPIFIDISEAEESIARLPVSRAAFLALLTRKIRVHGWLFDSSREHAILPFGQFFGVFSWKNAKDVVICHEVLQLKQDTQVADCMSWTRLMVLYNDLRSASYRTEPNPAAPEKKGLLLAAARQVRWFLTDILRAQDVEPAARKLAQQEFIITLSTVTVQCDVVDHALAADDLARAVIALEAAISSIHDLVNALTAAVTLTPRG